MHQDFINNCITLSTTTNYIFDNQLVVLQYGICTHMLTPTGMLITEGQFHMAAKCPHKTKEASSAISSTKYPEGGQAAKGVIFQLR